VNTPAHLILSAALFARPGDRRANVAALGGALLPDLSLYVLAGTSIALLGIPPATVFRELYFSDPWQTVFAVDNSLPLWGLVLAVALLARWRTVAIFAASGLLHLVFDFALHHDDARRHFWPLSDWVFRSPVSYWDSRHYGAIAGPVETLGALMLCVVLWRRFLTTPARALIALGAAFQLAPGLMFALML
jgi:hypothetical protein